MSRRINRACAVVAVAAISTTAFAHTPAYALEIRTSSPSASSAGMRLTPQQWSDIARTAARQGDLEAARHAQQLAKRGSGVAPAVLGSVAKKTIKIALKYGRKHLPSSVRKYADKLYDAVDWLDTSTEAALANGLIAIGVEPSHALFIAKWMMTFA